MLLQLGCTPQALLWDVTMHLRPAWPMGLYSYFSPSHSWVTTAPPTWKTSPLLAKLGLSGPGREHASCFGCLGDAS